jgi:hypothetical protein
MSNKSARQKLIQRYGNIDFLDQLKIAVPKCKKYSSKGQLKKMKQLTYHHIEEKSKGGPATIENGALLTLEHHRWFHQQSPEVQKELNSAFQELKQRIDKSQELSIVLVEEDELNQPFELNMTELSIDKQGKIQAYNCSKKKKEIRELIGEYEEELE